MLKIFTTNNRIALGIKAIGLDNVNLIEAIMDEGYADAKTARGCEGAIRRGIKQIFGQDSDVVKRQSYYSNQMALAYNDTDKTWAVEIAGYLTTQNPHFYMECENNYSIVMVKR
jgi:hypothetical protein